MGRIRFGSRLGLRRAFVASFLALFSSLSAAQSDTFRDETTTLLVEVPVEVTLDGEPLRGLTAANFELYDAGDRQEIEGLEVVDLETLEVRPDNPLAVARLPVVARRHFLLLFDLSFASTASVTKAREAAERLVANDLHEADLVSVATFSLAEGAKLLLGFTSDRDQVQVAIRSLGLPQMLERRSDSLRLYIGELEGSLGDGPEANAGGGPSQAGDLAAAHFRDLQSMIDRTQASQGRREVATMTRSMSQLAQTLRGVGGRKHVVYFSEGFDSQLLLGATDAGRRAEINRAAQDRELWRVDSSEYFGSADTLNVLDAMVQEFRRSDATVHSVDIGGLRAGGEAARGGGGGKDGLFMIADGTGGDFYENFNDLGQAMETMLERTSVTYILTYAPQGVKPNGKYRKLKVRLRDGPRKAKVVHRPGYFAPDPDAEASGLETQLDIAQRLLDGREGGDIETRLLAAPLRTPDQELGGLAYVPVLVEVDGPSFLGPESDGGETRAEVFVYAMDAKGNIRDFFSQSVGLTAGMGGGALERRGFKVYAPLVLGSGHYALRVLVRNADTGRSGLRLAALRVPAVDDDGPQLLPPLVPEGIDEWLLVRGRRSDLVAAAEPAYPFVHGSLTYAPAARPELAPLQAVPIFLAGYGLDGLTEMDSKILGADGETVALPRWRLDPRTNTDSGDGLERRIAAFEVPSLPAGDYRLQVAVGSGEDVVSHPVHLDFRIPPEGRTAASRLVAFDSAITFEDLANPGAGAEATQVAAERRRRDADADPALPMGQVAEDYRRALEQLLDGDRPGAIARLATVEQRAVTENPQRRIGRLARAELKVVKRLADRDLEALVPVMLLHKDVYLEHSRDGRPFLEFHSQGMVRRIADLYAERGDSEGSKVVAARALASLGGHLQAKGRTASLELFDRAVDLDPSNEAALLGLAAYYEKRGGPYDRVVAYLDRLVEARPASREGRLRLAINLLRVAELAVTLERSAKVAAAEAHFRRLMEEPGSDWIYSLAAQELARHLARTQQVKPATLALEEAIERRPEDQKLHIQLTYLRDRSHGAHQARKLAKRVSRELATRAPADRGRYNQWPSVAMDQDRRELDAGAAQRLGTLASALGRSTGSPGPDAGPRGEEK
ncbi:MAG: VWA domain-containing protein [Acidobacteriota bacterium]